MANDYTANDKAWKLVINATLNSFQKHCSKDTDAGKASEHCKAALKGPLLDMFMDADPDDADQILAFARNVGRAAAQMTK
tara:strand:- start:198 stop:437 length:240 start_codon:yes stop_codon:yes gene_type:complete